MTDIFDNSSEQTSRSRPAIVTRGLSRRFGDLLAVDRLDLEAPSGSFFGFLGPNGAGKSTTIAMLTGLLAPSEGTAEILGFDLIKDLVEIKKRIGVVPEQLPLFERLTGWESLLLAGRLYGVGRKEVRSRAEQLLRFMDLEEAATKLVIEYSHGMKKKLALSAALLHRPQILFLDEPFEGIDAVATRSIRNVLTDLVKKGLTIFLTSHVLETVEKLCDRVAIVHQGRLVANDTIDGLRKQLVAEQQHSGREESLEEVFLRFLGQTDHSEKHRLDWLEHH